MPSNELRTSSMNDAIREWIQNSIDLARANTHIQPHIESQKCRQHSFYFASHIFYCVNRYEVHTNIIVLALFRACVRTQSMVIESTIFTEAKWWELNAQTYSNGRKETELAKREPRVWTSIHIVYVHIWIERWSNRTTLNMTRMTWKFMCENEFHFYYIILFILHYIVMLPLHPSLFSSLSYHWLHERLSSLHLFITISLIHSPISNII